MDAGDCTKGGARPKDSGRKSRKNSRSKRTLRSPDSDSSDHLDVFDRIKNDFRLHPSKSRDNASYEKRCRTSRDKMKMSRSGFKSHDQSYPMIVCPKEGFLSSQSNLPDNYENVCLDANEISELNRKGVDTNMSQLEYISAMNDSFSDVADHKRIKCRTHFSSADTEEEKEATPFSSDYQGMRRFSNNEGQISVGGSMFCVKPAERRRKKRRKNKISAKPKTFGSYGMTHACSDPHNDCRSLNSSSPKTFNDDMFGNDDYIGDIFGPQRGWNLGHNFKAQQFSSSSSEADDEFECDCNFCHNNAITTDPTRIGLMRSFSSDRAEINNQDYSGLPDDSILSQTESAWDIIVQELVEQIRRFNVDIDLFNPSIALTNSDFESLPSMVPLRLGSYESQEIQICTICLSNYEGGEVAKILPCHHIFHVQCIKLWLAKSNTCPVCRNNVIKKLQPGDVFV